MKLLLTGDVHLGRRSPSTICEAITQAVLVTDLVTGEAGVIVDEVMAQLPK
jgi:hypothetical protein